MSIANKGCLEALRSSLHTVRPFLHATYGFDLETASSLVMYSRRIRSTEALDIIRGGMFRSLCFLGHTLTPVSIQLASKYGRIQGSTSSSFCLNFVSITLQPRMGYTNHGGIGFANKSKKQTRERSSICSL